MCHCRSCGSSAILPPCLCRYFVSSKIFLVSILWVRIFFSWIFCGSEIFSCEYFVDPKFFLVCISWLRNFSSWVFCWSKIFSRGYFVGPKFYFVSISCVQVFFLVADFVIQGFSVAGCMRKNNRNGNTEIHLKPRIPFQIDLNNC